MCVPGVGVRHGGVCAPRHMPPCASDASAITPAIPTPHVRLLIRARVAGTRAASGVALAAAASVQTFMWVPVAATTGTAAVAGTTIVLAAATSSLAMMWVLAAAVLRARMAATAVAAAAIMDTMVVGGGVNVNYAAQTRILNGNSWINWLFTACTLSLLPGAGGGQGRSPTCKLQPVTRPLTGQQRAAGRNTTSCQTTVYCGGTFTTAFRQNCGITTTSQMSGDDKIEKLDSN